MAIPDATRPKKARAPGEVNEKYVEMVDGIKKLLAERISACGNKSATKFYTLMLKSIEDGESLVAFDRLGNPPTAADRAEAGFESMLDMIKKMDAAITTMPFVKHKQPGLSPIGTFNTAAIKKFGLSPRQLKTLTDVYVVEPNLLNQYFNQPNAPRRTFVKGLVATIAGTGLLGWAAHETSQEPDSTNEERIVDAAQTNWNIAKSSINKYNPEDIQKAKTELEAAKKNLEISLKPEAFKTLSDKEKQSLQEWQKKWENEKEFRDYRVSAPGTLGSAMLSVAALFVLGGGTIGSVRAANNAMGTTSENRSAVIDKYLELIKNLDSLAENYSNIITPLTNELAEKMRQTDIS